MRIKLQEQPFLILALLLERPGAIVTREELQKRLWPGDTFVDFDLSLNSAVKKLRQALSDDSENPRFVETLYRRGYRFVAPVNGADNSDQIQLVESGSEAAAPTEPVPPPHAAFRFTHAAILLAAVILLVATFLWLREPLPPPRVLSAIQLTHDNLAKDALVADGARLYFNESFGASTIVSQVSSTGGDIAQITTAFKNAYLHDVAPRRSQLLLDSYSDEGGMLSTKEAPLWAIPMPAGSPRRIGDFNASDAVWSMDEQQLIYVVGHDLYLAKWDGTGAHKLVTVPGYPSLPKFSPDGTRLRFSLQTPDFSSFSLWEIGVDGRKLHAILPASFHEGLGECCGRWTPDGKYYFFQALRNGRSDVWALQERAGFLRWNGRQPVQITAGPLSYSSPAPSHDGSHLFVVGEQQRAELQRYDLKSRTFSPYLSGISAGQVDISRDGEWIVYVAYPDNTLWRSRTDGGEKLQLTYPPVLAEMPRWSNDGKQIIFVGYLPGQKAGAMVISAQGGTPTELLPDDKNTEDDPAWSPDGKTVLLAQYPPQILGGSAAEYSIVQVDLQTRQISKLPGASGFFAPRWSPDGRYISALTADGRKLMLFDVSTGQWSETASAKAMAYPNWSQDSKHVYYEDVGDYGSELDRVSIVDHKKDRVMSLKGVPRVLLLSGSPWNGVAPDGSPLIMRDVGNREIYSLEQQLP
jgi:Tol biopolymer transport system component/DNA-binding winged helix-turn-helix (wHTH) protein